MPVVEARYQRLSFDGVVPKSVIRGRCFRAGVILIGGCCLALFSTALRRQRNTEAVSLVGLANQKRGLVGSPSQFSPTLPFQPRRSNVPAQSKVAEASETSNGWDFGRFAKTAMFFDYLKPPSPFKVISQITGGNKGQRIEPEQVIYSPSANPLKLQWGPLDDVVMGGSSASTFDQATGAWKGQVIVANGGFVGLRTRNLDPPLDLSGCSGLQLKVKGQGQRVKFILRDDDEFNGIAWSYSFDTNPWFDTEKKISFSEFVPTKFARVVAPAPELKVATITGLQLTYSKFEYEGALNPKFEGGDFQFEVKAIDTF